MVVSNHYSSRIPHFVQDLPETAIIGKYGGRDICIRAGVQPRIHDYISIHVHIYYVVHYVCNLACCRKKGL